MLTRRKIYRAFPELDGYDDEHCVRFMRAAGKSLLHKLLTCLSMTTIAAIGIAIAFFGALALARKVGLATPRNPDADLPLIGGVWLAVMLVCGTLMFWARDLLLWFRVGHVLRERGTCETCGYILVGLAIGPGNLVTCPECASETKVDESLGELVLDEQGRASFNPSQFSAGHAARRIDPRVLRRRKRIILWSVLGVVLSPVIIAATYGVVLLLQAAAASNARPKAANYATLFPSAAAPAGAANAWKEVAKVMPSVYEASGLSASGSGWSVVSITASYSRLGGFRVSELQSITWAWGIAPSTDDQLIRTLDAISAQHQWAEISAALHAPEHRPPGDGWGDPTNAIRYAVPSDVINAANLEIGRMNLARLRGDPAEFAAAAGDALQAVHMLALQPWNGAFVSSPLSSMVWCSIIDAAHAGGPAWVKVIYPVVRNAPRLPPAIETVKATHMAMNDYVCWLFEDPSHVWLERWSDTVQGLLPRGIVWPQRLGFYWENAALVDRTFGAVEKSLASDKSFSTGAPPVTGASNLVLSGLMPSVFWSFNSIENDQLLQDGAITFLCIEKYNLDHGDYPATLQTLVDAGMLPALPIDPYSGKPLIYERAGPKAAAHHAPYVLYSVGPDGNDDGLVQPDNLPLLPTATPSGHDFSFPILDEEPTP
ncbi:MAG: hypothetical protein GC200_01830 [Tepidisphaera sp.]|nr:hypothetical protein [Tepidisphaera sp.]